MTRDAPSFRSWPQAAGVDAADHLDLVAAAADQHALQADLLQERRHQGQFPGHARQDADHRDVAGDADGGHGLLQRRRTADVEGDVAAGGLGAVPGRLPVPIHDLEKQRFERAARCRVCI